MRVWLLRWKQGRAKDLSKELVIAREQVEEEKRRRAAAAKDAADKIEVGLFA